MFMTKLLHEKWPWNRSKGLYMPRDYAGSSIKSAEWFAIISQKTKALQKRVPE